MPSYQWGRPMLRGRTHTEHASLGQRGRCAWILREKSAISAMTKQDFDRERLVVGAAPTTRRRAQVRPPPHECHGPETWPRAHRGTKYAFGRAPKTTRRPAWASRLEARRRASLRIPSIPSGRLRRQCEDFRRALEHRRPRSQESLGTTSGAPRGVRGLSARRHPARYEGRKALVDQAY